MIENAATVKLHIDNNELDYVDSFTYLGIKLDRELKFDQQLKETKRLVTHKTYLLSRIRCYLNNDQALAIFKSKIVPYFDYGNIFYHDTNQALLKKLQSIQNRALRICLHCPPLTSTDYVHKTTKTNYLKSRREAHILQVAYKRSVNPVYIQPVRRHSTRLFDGIVLNNILAKGKAAGKECIL